jgi:hypothetical protein
MHNCVEDLVLCQEESTDDYALMARKPRIEIEANTAGGDLESGMQNCVEEFVLSGRVEVI